MMFSTSIPATHLETAFNAAGHQRPGAPQLVDEAFPVFPDLGSELGALAGAAPAAAAAAPGPSFVELPMHLHLAGKPPRSSSAEIELWLAAQAAQGPLEVQPELLYPAQSAFAGLTLAESAFAGLNLAEPPSPCDSGYSYSTESAPGSPSSSPFSAPAPGALAGPALDLTGPGPLPTDAASYRDEHGSWACAVTELPTVDLNIFLKRTRFTKDEVADLKKVRRARKNQVYTKRSRVLKAAREGRLADPIDPNTLKGQLGHAAVAPKAWPRTVRRNGRARSPAPAVALPVSG